MASGPARAATSGRFIPPTITVSYAAQTEAGEVPPGILEIESPVNYSSHMVEVRRSGTFDQWLEKLRDVRAVARINIRIERLVVGNPGEVAPVGEGVSELKIDYGPGYRVYFIRDGEELVVLLCGGDKKSQTKDIQEAKRIAKEWKAQR